VINETAYCPSLDIDKSDNLTLNATVLMIKLAPSQEMRECVIHSWEK